MNTNEIYKKINENLISSLKTFKKGEMNSAMLNENVILNLSSMCKFLDGKDKFNSSVMDVLVPMTKFDTSVSQTIKKYSTNMAQSDDNEDFPFNTTGNDDDNIFSSANKLRNSEGNNDIARKSKLTNTFIRDMNGNNNFRESMLEGTLFSQSIMYDNESMHRESIADIMNRTEMSTIYGRRSEMDDNMSVVSGQTFAKYFSQGTGEEHKKKMSTQPLMYNSF